MPMFDTLAYGGEKTPVVFDIGTAYTKCGFSSECSPRKIVPSTVKKAKTGELVNIYDISDREELYRLLIDFVHLLYFRHVLVPKERRVVIVESVFTPTMFRETLAGVLFKHYEVPSVVFVPAHLMALFTLGIPSGLVMDCGYKQTIVLPVYEGIPVLKACQALPFASKAVHNYLDAQLREHGIVRDSQGEEKPLSSVKDIVDENILEDIKVRCCFVTKLDRAQQIHAVSAGIKDAELPAPPPDVQYPLDGANTLTIPGKIREHTFEILFERDSEEQSVSTLLLDAIIQCPIDIRKTLAENIILIGGTCMSVGFQHRILTELYSLLNSPRYKNRLALKSFKFHHPPSKRNCVAWLGGAIFGIQEILSTRSISRDQYTKNHCMLPDWCSLYDYEESDNHSAILLKKEASKEVLPSVSKSPRSPVVAKKV
ncbi:hypothetical protein LSH36_1198g00002 [Paralvinella palmiformis]|uniref:Actin-related protein 10 n=1 Tax=Paralvinella palmiformis TaxID=53620 RepID=A0AAD9IU92_9ANNE|nr:hypothetical protein LSH36_1198g00002 [Paralvinella palmiformis]